MREESRIIGLSLLTLMNLKVFILRFSEMAFEKNVTQVDSELILKGESTQNRLSFFVIGLPRLGFFRMNLQIK